MRIKIIKRANEPISVVDAQTNEQIEGVIGVSFSSDAFGDKVIITVAAFELDVKTDNENSQRL